jgi:hypothetical protein
VGVCDGVVVLAVLELDEELCDACEPPVTLGRM